MKKLKDKQPNRFFINLFHLLQRAKRDTSFQLPNCIKNDTLLAQLWGVKKITDIFTALTKPIWAKSQLASIQDLNSKYAEETDEGRKEELRAMVNAEYEILQNIRLISEIQDSLRLDSIKQELLLINCDSIIIQKWKEILLLYADYKQALILRSIFSGLVIEGWHPSESDGEDVTHIGQALRDLAAGKREFKIGDSGTGFRFLLARLSRESGEFLIHGSERLFSRPHLELYRVLGLLGAKVRVESPTSVRLGARGWPKGPIQLSVDAAESSQFASALLLAGSNIGDGVSLEVRTHADSPMRSGGYLEMTTRMLEQIGCQVSRQNGRGQMLIQIKAPAGDHPAPVSPATLSKFSVSCCARTFKPNMVKITNLQERSNVFLS